MRYLREWTIEIIKRSDTVKGFEVLRRRWVVERTFAWLGRSRRLSKDWEKSIASTEAWIFVAHIRLLTRRLEGIAMVDGLSNRALMASDGRANIQFEHDPDTKRPRSGCEPVPVRFGIGVIMRHNMNERMPRPVRDDS